MLAPGATSGGQPSMPLSSPDGPIGGGATAGSGSSRSDEAATQAAGDAAAGLRTSQGAAIEGNPSASGSSPGAEETPANKLQAVTSEVACETYALPEVPADVSCTTSPQQVLGTLPGPAQGPKAAESISSTTISRSTEDGVHPTKRDSALIDDGEADSACGSLDVAEEFALELASYSSVVGRHRPTSISESTRPANRGGGSGAVTSNTYKGKFSGARPARPNPRPAPTNNLLGRLAPGTRRQLAARRAAVASGAQKRVPGRTGDLSDAPPLRRSNSMPAIRKDGSARVRHPVGVPSDADQLAEVLSLLAGGGPGGMHSPTTPGGEGCDSDEFAILQSLIKSPQVGPAVAPNLLPDDLQLLDSGGEPLIFDESTIHRVFGDEPERSENGSHAEEPADFSRSGSGRRAEGSSPSGPACVASADERPTESAPISLPDGRTVRIRVSSARDTSHSRSGAPQPSKTSASLSESSGHQGKSIGGGPAVGGIGGGTERPHGPQGGGASSRSGAPSTKRGNRLEHAPEVSTADAAHAARAMQAAVEAGDQKYFMCPVPGCDRRYVIKYGLTRHMNNKHGAESVKTYRTTVAAMQMRTPPVIRGKEKPAAAGADGGSRPEAVAQDRGAVRKRGRGRDASLGAVTSDKVGRRRVDSVPCSAKGADLARPGQPCGVAETRPADAALGTAARARAAATAHAAALASSRPWSKATPGFGVGDIFPVDYSVLRYGPRFNSIVKATVRNYQQPVPLRAPRVPVVTTKQYMQAVGLFSYAMSLKAPHAMRHAALHALGRGHGAAPSSTSREMVQINDALRIIALGRRSGVATAVAALTNCTEGASGAVDGDRSQASPEGRTQGVDGSAHGPVDVAREDGTGEDLGRERFGSVPPGGSLPSQMSEARPLSAPTFFGEGHP